MRHVSDLERARSALERGGRFPAGALARTIARSWRRCADLGLDPKGAPESHVVDANDLKERRERRDLLRRLAIAEMQLLYSQIAGSNFMIAFGDPDGVVLDTISDHHFAGTASGRTIVPGSMWSEDVRGTNALGLVAIEKAPVAVYGREHYFACQGQVSCMSAPVFDSTGQIVGLLDASSSHEARQEHTMALVRMATAQIENSLIFHEQAGLLILAFHPRVEYLNTLSAGVIAVTDDGQICTLNQRSQVLLAGLNAGPGKMFEDIFEACFESTLNNLLEGGITQVRDRTGSGLFFVCRQIGGRNGRLRAVKTSRRAIQTTPRKIDAPFVCSDPRLVQQMESVAQAVKSSMPVHISGETGTGKELMARHAHNCSGRKGEFVAVNCGAIAESLFVAELFGYEKGAFTDARAEGSPGLIRMADRGTLFLDEVGNMPLAAQAALLRFLDTMEVRPVGGQKNHSVDLQIVSATNRRLEQEVAQRRFREDLLYRLNAMEVVLPPLRERQDFLEVVRFLMDRIAPGVAITDKAIERLRDRAWPGNFRELRATLQRVVIRAGNRILDEGAIALFLGDGIQADDACPECRGHALKSDACRRIRQSHRTTGGNIAETARLLGVSRTTVYKHLRGPEEATGTEWNRPLYKGGAVGVVVGAAS